MATQNTVAYNKSSTYFLSPDGTLGLAIFLSKASIWETLPFSSLPFQPEPCPRLPGKMETNSLVRCSGLP
jgi:hypothetical protein